MYQEFFWLDTVLTDFVKIQDVDSDIIQKYQELLPPEIISVWQKYGFGTFKNGYFKIINPEEFTELLQISYFKGEDSLPVFATAFGDLIVWEENRFVTIVKYRYGDFDVMLEGFEYFDQTISDEELADEFYTFKKYDSAVKKYGVPDYDECFGYVPLLGLGGKESVNHIKRVKLKEHIAFIADMLGEV